MASRCAAAGVEQGEFVGVELAFMTSLVLPALWTIWRTWQLRRGTLEGSLGRSRAEG